jgi:hypothetical protein
MPDMLRAYNPNAEVVKVITHTETGHFLGDRFPAGTECRACWDEERNLWDVEMPDGNLIRMQDGTWGATRV